MSVEDFIINVFCFVASEIQKVPGSSCLRSRGFPPKLSDEEVITIEVVGEFLGLDADTSIWRYFKTHFQDWFPGLGSRSNYSKQSANLWYVKQNIQTSLSQNSGAVSDILHMADGFPIPVCHFRRANFSRIFSDSATFGYCASKKETYYGFKGNLVINSEGIITCITVAPAHFDERESLWEVIGNIKGLLIADKGLIGDDYKNQIRHETGVNLQTPIRNNMKDKRGKDASSWLTSTRRLVETVIGQLVERFNIEKVRARDCWHLTNRISRKILAHTIAACINKSHGLPTLCFDRLAKP